MRLFSNYEPFRKLTSETARLQRNRPSGGINSAHAGVSNKPRATNAAKHGWIQNATKWFDRDEVRSREPPHPADVDSPVQTVPVRAAHQADDYLTKPFAFAELLVRVKALLRRGPVTRASVLRVRDLELDRLSQQVRKGGRRVELTAKEYGVLEYLMANAGRVLSRTMILEHVWDQSFDGATNIVGVYVRHLRSKVDDAHDQQLIRTIRGLGYVISEREDEA